MVDSMNQSSLLIWVFDPRDLENTFAALHSDKKIKKGIKSAPSYYPLRPPHLSLANIMLHFLFDYMT